MFCAAWVIGARGWLQILPPPNVVRCLIPLIISIFLPFLPPISPLSRPFLLSPPECHVGWSSPAAHVATPLRDGLLLCRPQKSWNAWWPFTTISGFITTILPLGCHPNFAAPSWLPVRAIRPLHSAGFVWVVSIKYLPVRWRVLLLLDVGLRAVAHFNCSTDTAGKFT